MAEDEIEEALRLYLAGPDILEEALSGITEKELDARATDEGWTVREIVHHLADADSMWMTLVKIIVITPGSKFSYAWHPGNRGIAKALNYTKRPIGPALALFRVTREHIVQMLRATPDVWENHLVGIEVPDDEPDFKITVGEYITGLTKHLREHVEEIASMRTRAKRGVNSDGTG